jgi:hypothetical protein
MRPRRLAPAEFAAIPPAALAGAVLLAPVRLPDGTLLKGTRLQPSDVLRLRTAALSGALPQPIRLAELEPGDLHEDVAAARLAEAVAGQGVSVEPPRQSRLDLTARWDGVLHVRVGELTRVNTLDAVEVFTLYHGQAVVRGDTVASVKVAPHVVAEELIAEGEAIARAATPLVDVRPYRSLEVGVIAEEALTAEGLARFVEGARHKVEALGGRLVEAVQVATDDPAQAEIEALHALERLVRGRGCRVVLVGGVSAGDPLSPFYAALAGLGGRVLRRGVPAHPGSMIWLAELDGSRVLGVPQCGMFALATAADLVLPRLLTGEALGAAELADLAHGGVLGPAMRFRFPGYARNLRSPSG